MRETWVQSLGEEEPLEKEMANHSSILAMEGGAWQAIVHGVTKSQTRLRDFTHSNRYQLSLLVNYFSFLGTHWTLPSYISPQINCRIGACVRVHMHTHTAHTPAPHAHTEFIEILNKTVAFDGRSLISQLLLQSPKSQLCFFFVNSHVKLFYCQKSKKI